MITKHKINAQDLAIAENFKFYRKSLGISLFDIAKALNLSTQQVQKYEKGINRISCGTMQLISKYFNIPVSTFFNHDHAEQEINDNIFKIIRILNKIKNPTKQKVILNLAKELAS